MEEKTFPHKLAAILYADVDGYSRLTSADEEGTHKTLSTYLDLITSEIKKYRGRPVHFAGDAVLAEFASLVDAVDCAMEIQQELRRRNETFPQGRKLQFRIGINLGEVIVDRNDIFGEGVNVAARLESLADPGGVCISASVYEQIKNKVDFIFDDLGEHTVKNIAEPVRAYRGRITPDDLPAKRIAPTTRAAWRGAAIAIGAVLTVEAVGMAIWYGFLRTPPPEPEFLQSATQAELKLGLKPVPKNLSPGTVFRECGDCPEMIVIPKGAFMMGARKEDPAASHGEGPVHKVTFDRPFAVGRYEVTFAQWDACVISGGCKHTPQDRGWGRGNRPVIYVSWEDAGEYVGWLSKLTGRTYRLLSESEWEYSARANTDTVYWWGNDIGLGKANCKGCGEAGGNETTPVGKYEPNAFGLYDIHGNVWEWTADCWNGTYAGAPTDGTPWTQPGCNEKVLRGGSWGIEPPQLRAARRKADKPDVRSGKQGFRVAMTLP